MILPVLRPIDFDEFERRVAAEPDLTLSWTYWNVLLPETAPRYFLWLLQRLLIDWDAYNRSRLLPAPPPSEPQT